MQERKAAERKRSVQLTGLHQAALVAVPLGFALAIGLAARNDPPPQPQTASTAAAAPVAATQQPAPAPSAVQYADFRGEQASPDARLMANWIVATRDHQKHAFILVDKKEARAYVFTPEGRLKASAPVLLGASPGDDLPPGVAEKDVTQITPQEKLTPAGRFVAEPGVNADNEDVIWVDYDAAISMHRVRPQVKRERRLERLATLATEDNRISFGCINLPVSFYEDVARPIVKQHGAIVYVLPETRSVQQVFGAYDVTDPTQVAATAQPARAGAAGKEARKAA
jgi:hypothetical protein